MLCSVHHQRGETFNAPYKRIRKDWFFHNPTRANVGSLGRVADVPTDAITSPEYQVWRIKRDLLPDFVEILIQTEFFSEQIAFHRVGAVKERLFVQNLLEIPIPVVPLPVQREIVAACEAARKFAATTATKIERLQRDIEARFLADLGLDASEQATLPKAFGVWWKNLGRWSVMFNQLAGTATDISCGEFPVATLGKVATVSYGIQKSPTNRPGQHPRPYLRVANVQRGELDLREIKYIDVADKELAGLRLEPGDVLFVEGNGSKAELGRCALWQGEISDCVHQNHILKVRPDSSALLSEYAMTWFNTDAGKDHFFRSAKTSSGLGTINSSELRAAPIPVPPFPVQKQIMKRVEAGRAEIAALKADRKARADAAKANVEATILGTKPK